MDRIIQIATNAVPLRAVFSTGAVTPVIGLALVQSELDSMRVNLPGGIAIFNDGMVVCEQVECFLGYAEPIKVLPDGKIEDEAKNMYDKWVVEQKGKEQELEPEDE